MSTTSRGSRRMIEVARALADEHGLPFIALVENELDHNAYFSLPERLIRRGTVLPYRIDEGRLQVAVADPSDVALIDELRLVATMPVDLAVAPAADIARFCADGPRTKRAARPIADERDTGSVRALDSVIADAIDRHASDVHLLPTQDGLEVRFRVDGMVSKHSVLEPEIGSAVISRLKVMELLREGDAGELTDEQHQFVSIVERNSDRLLRLVGDLLFVAQVEAGKITLERESMHVEELVRQAVDAARPAATEKDIEIALDLEGLGELHADRARLAQVIDNLISNALKFTEPGGHVCVRTSRQADMGVIEVSDDGMGMSAEDQDRLFERFFRTASATDQAIQGTGLGLAIVKAIVEAHQGVITVESVEGEGTVFRIELPLTTIRRPVAA